VKKGPLAEVGLSQIFAAPGFVVLAAVGEVLQALRLRSSWPAALGRWMRLAASGGFGVWAAMVATLWLVRYVQARRASRLGRSATMEHVARRGGAACVVEALLQPAAAASAVTCECGGCSWRQYELAFVTKTFTGILLSRMVVSGEVTLSTGVGQLLAIPAPSSSVTLRELALHTSGLGRYPVSLKWHVRTILFGVHGTATDDVTLVTWFRRSYSQRRRGRYVYSNVGYDVLALCLLSASGETDFQTLMQRKVIGPLNLNQTTFSPMHPAVGRGRVGLKERPLAGAAGSYGLWSTAADISRLGTLLAQPDLVDDQDLASAISLATTRQQTPGGPMGFGVHFAPGPDDVLFKDGGAPGATAVVAASRRTGTAVSLLLPSGSTPGVSRLCLTLLGNSDEGRLTGRPEDG
jgi:CubicO group peptidase (beta-lactamase class C family)